MNGSTVKKRLNNENVENIRYIGNYNSVGRGGQLSLGITASKVMLAFVPATKDLVTKLWEKREREVERERVVERHDD